MDHGVSLCIITPYLGIEDVTAKKRIYRIADYSHGQFYPINPSEYSDNTIDFSPRYIRCSPFDEHFLEYYQPVVRSWKAVQSNYDITKSVTESYQYKGADVYEVVINRELVGKDIDYGKTVFQLPEGVTESFLLAIDQDETTLTVALCKTSQIRKTANGFMFDNRIEDLIHATHSLNTYVIEKGDVFNTSGFGLKSVDTMVPAPVRYFYVFDSLPEMDSKLYLYQFDDYLPYYVSKYMRKYAKDYELSKNDIQRVISAIQDAFNNEEEMNEYYRLTGYDASDYYDKLPQYEELVLKYINESEFLDDILTKIVLNNNEYHDKYLEIVREQWLKEADEQRSKVNNELGVARESLSELTQTIEEKRSEKELLQKDIDEKKAMNSSVESVTESVLQDFDKKVEELIVNNRLLQCIGGGSNSEERPHAQDNSDIFVKDAVIPDGEKKIVDDYGLAKLLFEKNFQQMGVLSQYRNILSAIILSSGCKIHSFIVSGYFARDFADSISYSFEGTSAAQIAITSPHINYSNMYNAVTGIVSKTILIENLLDTCNESVYMMLNKDFPDKWFVVSYEQEETLSLISKTIWNYGILVNTDFLISHEMKENHFYRGSISNDVKYPPIEEDVSSFAPMLNILRILKIPTNAAVNFTRIYAFLTATIKEDNLSAFIDSILSKFCVIYGNEIDQDELSEIIQNLPEEMKQFYDL